MLVLERRREESIVIDGDIVVTVLDIDGDRVKVGIEAPRSVAILRRELCDAVKGENHAAVASLASIRKVFPALRDKLVSSKAGG